jgi:HAD superfamily hydrolase (TIGR01509 family)
MIKAIITDFDGTLFDTFEANYFAYKDVLNSHGLELSKDTYRKCFGLRFNEFMESIGIKNIVLKNQIKTEKAKIYPNYFDLIAPNFELIAFLRTMKRNGIKIAIASTARRENLINVLSYFDLTDIFDVIFTGESVMYGKPHPEIYILTMDKLGVEDSETLIFEDSEVGIQAAQASGASVIKIKEKLF